MALFGLVKPRPSTCEDVAEMIARNFQRRKLDLEAHELGDCEGYGWWVREGTAMVYIFVQDEPAGPVIKVTSPIVHYPPANREAFFNHLLELNRDLSACCLAAFQEVVLVTGQRPIEGLDDHELEFLIWNVARCADRLDAQLARDFGARPYRENC